MATVSNLYVDQGTDFSAIITLKNQDGSTLNLTGFTVASQFRKSYQSSSATNFIVSIYNATQGKIRMQLPAATSSALLPGRYLYDVEITSPTNERKRALEGIVVLTAEITK
jgi:hypothetical protein